MPTARYGLAAAVGPDKLIYVTGGEDDNENVLTTVEAYDPTTDTWTEIAPMSTPRVSHGCVTGSNGLIYTIGGFFDLYTSPPSVEAYSVRTHTWSAVASMNTARENVAAVLGPDRRLYAFGGFGPGSLNSVEALAVSSIGMKSLSLSPDPVVGSLNAIGTVTLTNPATAGGTTVTLTSANPNVANLTVKNITIPAGSQKGTFSISTIAVSTSTPVTISATANGTTKNKVLTVRPIGVLALTIVPNTVVNGDNVIGVVTLEAPAAPGGITITVSSSNPEVANPTVNSFTIPAGTYAAAFDIITGSVSAPTTVTITTTANGITKKATIKVFP